MKKSTMILALAFGLGFLFTSSVQAIHPMNFTGIFLNASRDFQFEKELILEDWMLSVESFTPANEATAEQEIGISSWMLEANWNMDDTRMASEEPGLKVEDWMLDVNNRDDNSIALENWMLHIAG